MKDNFSARSDKYAKFRPTYPKELYTFLLSLIEKKERAWDCGTGNGQIARELAKHFTEVYATDISESQVSNAVTAENIFYKVQPVEESSFPPEYFDLIVVGQAIHWFNFEAFYKVVRGTLKPEGIFAVVGYSLFRTGDETDRVIDHFYKDITHPYWDDERHYVDENYKTIPFPFKEIEAPQITSTVEWTFEQMVGYLGTWSAVQHYIKANGKDPVELVLSELQETWPQNTTKTITFNFFLRAGKL
jgi:SAM-dependent methyltransferase